MSRAGKIARRTFLVGSAVVVGGLAVGVYLYRRTPANPLLRTLGPGEVALTPYVRIDGNGITLITPRADVGQGAYSVQAALLAEELDVAWQDIRLDPGPTGLVYYNTAVVAETLPIAATTGGMLERAARVIGDAGAKFLDMQITGGSSTVPDSYEKLRVAGAAARAMLLQAAAQQTGIASEKLATRDGAVITPDGKSLSYRSLAEAAARLESPAEVTLKPESAWRYLGKKMPRLDMVPKCTGALVFGIDLRLPDMVYATVRANPRLGGGMKSYDASAATAARGVLKVVPITGGLGVIADNTWRAFRAASLLKVDWGPAPYPPSTATMFEQVAGSFTDAHRDSRFKDEGDVEAALQGAGTKAIQSEYRLPFLAHAPLEPMNAVVRLKDGRLDIWTGTQVPMFVLKTAAKLTGLDAERIHLHMQYSGGSFGRRLEDDYVAQAIELAMALPGRPVKMTWTREEDMTHDMPRPLAIARARGIVKDDKVEAYDLAIASPAVNASQFGRQKLPMFGPDTAIVAGAWDQPFRIPNYRVTGYRAKEMVPVSSWRSVGASGNGFLHDCFLDELIHAAGADPLGERLRLCWHEPSRNVLKTVGEMSKWGSALGPNRGRGVAFVLSFGVPVAEVVEVTVTTAGIRIDKVFVAAEVGKVLDPDNLESQLQGGVIWGLGHAMHGQLTYADGMAEQTNFHDFQAMRLHQAPQIEVRALGNGGAIRGIGEPGVPPAAPALANAIFAATGQRIYRLPLSDSVRFA
jgi:isoquinoline 1-oxidoreductase beta subunit